MAHHTPTKLALVLLTSLLTLLVLLALPQLTYQASVLAFSSTDASLPAAAPAALSLTDRLNRVYRLLQSRLTRLHRHQPQSQHDLDNAAAAAGAASQVLILQHVKDPEDPLHMASIATHRLYASLHGYRYAADTHLYVRGNPKAESMNKVWSVVDVMARELDSGHPARWIMMTDADTLVTSPLTPLLPLLPPPSLHPQPFILGAQDHNGLNAGVIFFHPHPLTLSFLRGLIAAAETYDNTTATWAPSDQYLLGLGLMDDHEMQRHFYEYPRLWFNAYGLGDREIEGAMVQIHLVNALKGKGFRQAIEANARAAEAAHPAESEHEGGQEEGAVDREGIPEEWIEHEVAGDDAERLLDIATRAGGEWWARAKPGIDNMRFLLD